MFNHMDSVEAQRIATLELVDSGKGRGKGRGLEKGKASEPFMDMVDDAVRDLTIAKFVALKRTQHLKNEAQSDAQAGDQAINASVK